MHWLLGAMHMAARLVQMRSRLKWCLQMMVMTMMTSSSLKLACSQSPLVHLLEVLQVIPRMFLCCKAGSGLLLFALQARQAAD